MAKRSKKEKKRTNRMPPLSFVDRLIYWVILLLLGGTYILLGLGTFFLRRSIGFQDGTAVAVSANNSAWWLIVPWITFFLITFGLWVSFYENRKPIFGRRNCKYGPPTYASIFPLFMKNKPYEYDRVKKQKQRKRIAMVLTVVLLISFIPYPWSLYGRTCLRQDGSMVQYTMFNAQADEYSTAQIARVDLETYHYTTGSHKSFFRRTHWGIQMVLQTNSGNEYTFHLSEFRSDPLAETSDLLITMINLKSRYDPAILHYSGVQELGLVSSDMQLSQEEIKLLYQLFAQ